MTCVGGWVGGCMRERAGGWHSTMSVSLLDSPPRYDRRSGSQDSPTMSYSSERSVRAGIRRPLKALPLRRGLAVVRGGLSHQGPAAAEAGPAAAEAGGA